MRDEKSTQLPRSGAGASSNGVPLDPAEFLTQHPPFDRLQPQLLGAVAHSLEICFEPRGATILQQDGETNTRLYVIRRGVVRLEADKRRTELLEEPPCDGVRAAI